VLLDPDVVLRADRESVLTGIPMVIRGVQDVAKGAQLDLAVLDD
jgi:hypothetical protein